MEPYLITVDSQGRSSFKHDGEEFLYVLEGTLEFHFGGEMYILKPGDSIYFVFLILSLVVINFLEN